MTEGRLVEHLADTDEEARAMVDSLTLELAQKHGIGKHLKEANSLLWVQGMNNCKASAEEVVLRELIYS